MPFDVVANLFFRHSAARRTKISPRPKMSPPVPLPQMRKLLLQFALGRPTFHFFHQLGWTQRGRTRGENVHVVLANVSLLDPHVQPETRLTDHLPGPIGHLSLQYVISVFGHPYQMIFDIVDRVRSAPVAVHFWEARSLCKNSLPIR